METESIFGGMYNRSCPRETIEYELLKRMKWCAKESLFDIYPYFDFERARNIFNDMVIQGFLRPITLNDFLQSMILPELKQLCKENGLKVSGKKAELITSLIDGVDSYRLGYTEEAIRERYSLTEKGYDYLNKLITTRNNEIQAVFVDMIKKLLEKDVKGANKRWIEYKINEYFQNPFDISAELDIDTEDAIISTLYEYPKSMFTYFAAFSVIGGIPFGDIAKHCRDSWLQSGHTDDEAKKCHHDFFHYICSKRDLFNYKRSGIKHYRILATLDGNTCPVCGELDRKVFCVQDAEIFSNFPPLHNGCRCTTVSYFEDREFGNAKRSGRDPETGKSVLYPINLTWKEWKEKYQK